jgi:hypothetical protein
VRGSDVGRVQEESRTASAASTASATIANGFHFREPGYDPNWAVGDVELADFERN